MREKRVENDFGLPVSYYNLLHEHASAVGITHFWREIIVAKGILFYYDRIQVLEYSIVSEIVQVSYQSCHSRPNTTSVVPGPVLERHGC